MPLPRLNIAKFGSVPVGLSSVPLPTNSTSPKEVFLIQNLGAGKIFWGSDSTVTIVNGFPVSPSISIDYGGPVWLISDTAAQDVRYVVLS